MNKYLKVAIVHDWLWNMAGSARVTESFLQMYPDADLFMLFGDTAKLSKSFKDRTVRYSWLQKLPFISKLYRFTYFLWPMAVESFDLSEYDLVISSSQSVVKGVITGTNTTHLTYIHSPMRYGWDMYFDYFSGYRLIKRVLISILVHYLRIWDVTSSQRADIVVTNSDFIKDRFEKYYGRKVDYVVNPPVDTEKCIYSGSKDNYCLTISPFEPNKGGELLIDTAIKYGFKLKVIGVGSLKKKLEKKAKKHSNIEFLGWVSEGEKYKLLSKANCLVSAGIEDYGIAMVEAIVSGTPVVTSHQGGGAGIVEDGVTGVLFKDTTEQSLYSAIEEAKNIKVKELDSNQYSKERFMGDITQILSD